MLCYLLCSVLLCAVTHLWNFTCHSCCYYQLRGERNGFCDQSRSETPKHPDATQRLRLPVKSLGCNVQGCDHPRFAISQTAELTTNVVRLHIMHPTESTVERLHACPAIGGAPSLNRTIKQLVEQVFVVLQVDPFPSPHSLLSGCSQ